MRKQSQHRPVHLYVDNTPYFITGAIYLKRCLLSSAESKKKLIKLIQGYFNKYEWELHHWVILDNHYHLLGKSKKGKDMPMIIKGIHSVSGKSILEDTKCAKPVWWNYWDYCPRDEKEYYTRLNYLFYNPVKHGYTNDLNCYGFSSFQKLLAKLGREKMVEQFRKYPDYKTMVLTETGDDF